jgi:hypothetical protein
MRAPFSLLFRSASQPVLPQKLYNLKNEKFGRLEIFRDPEARDRNGVLYQAVFNQAYSGLFSKGAF